MFEIEEEEYLWIKKSPFFENSDEANKLQNIFCSKNTTDIFLYLEVIYFREIFDRPPEFYELFISEMKKSKHLQCKILLKIYELNTNNFDFFNFLLDFENFDEIKVAEKAAYYGFIDYFEFLLHKKISIPTDVCKHSAGNGKIECLKFLYENDFLITCETVNLSSKNGHFECLKFCYEKIPGIVQKLGNPLYYAILGNSDTCMKFLLERGESFDGTHITACILSCNLPLFELISKKTGIKKSETWILKVACQGGNLDFLKYLHKEGYEMNFEASNMAMHYGNLDCLKYLVDNKCEILPEHLYHSIKPGNEHIMEYLLNSGSFLGNGLTRMLINGNKIHYLINLHSKFPGKNLGLTSDDFNYAINSGNIEALKFLHENGCPYDGNIQELAKNDERCLKYISALKK